MRCAWIAATDSSEEQVDTALKLAARIELTINHAEGRRRGRNVGGVELHVVQCVERVNARLKDEFGASQIRVRGAVKIMAHLMFGVIALTVDQWLRLAAPG